MEYNPYNFEMKFQLNIPIAQYQMVWNRKVAIQARYNVRMKSSVAYDDAGFICNNSNAKDGLKIVVNGTLRNKKALKEYVDQVFVHPEIIELFNYQPNLAPIFGNAVWIEVLEEIYAVCVTSEPEEYELSVSGQESSVSSAVEDMNHLVMLCKDKETPQVLSEKSSIERLVSALKVCKNVEVSPNLFHGFTSDVLNFLLLWLKRAFKDSFFIRDFGCPIDGSCLTHQTPATKTHISAVIDSNGHNETDKNNLKRPLETFDSLSDLSSKKPKQSSLHEITEKAVQPLMNGSSHWDFPNPLLNQNGGGLLILYTNRPADNNKVQLSCVFPVGPVSLFPVSNSHTLRAQEPEAGIPFLSPAVPVQPMKLLPVETIPVEQKGLRPIVIDGCNVAYYSTKGRDIDFSWKRIMISIQYFLDRGHTNVKVFMPLHKRALCCQKAGKIEHVDKLEIEHVLIFTPSRVIDGRRVSCYDDLFVVDLAHRTGGVILSNDHYRDIMAKKPEWVKTIKDRLLMYVFAGDELMIPEDPLGPKGPRLKNFLEFPDVQ